MTETGRAMLAGGLLMLMESVPRVGQRTSVFSAGSAGAEWERGGELRIAARKGRIEIDGRLGEPGSPHRLFVPALGRRSDLLGLHPDNIFMVKLNYWINL